MFSLQCFSFEQLNSFCNILQLNIHYFVRAGNVMERD